MSIRSRSWFCGLALVWLASFAPAHADGIFNPGSGGSVCGTAGQICYNNAGTLAGFSPGTGVQTALGLTLNGSGALTATTSPAFVTPALGAATGTSLALTPTPAATLTTDQGQAGTGTTLLAFASTTGAAVGQIVSGTSVPLGTEVASIVATAQKVQAANGSFLTAQKVIPMATTVGFAVGQQCADTTGTGVIGAGNVIASIQANVSITLTANVLTASSGAADSITCDPVVTLTQATTAAIAASASINFTTNHTSLSALSALYDTGDASVNGNLNVGGSYGVMAGTSLALAAGTVSAPAVQVGASSGTGIYSDSGGILDIAAAGTQSLRVSANGFFIPISAGSFNLSSGGLVGFSSGTAGSVADDVALSRISAGVMGVGTGAQGSSAGTLQAAILRTSTAYTVATLPTGAAGMRAYVTDQLTACPALGASFTGGGSVICPAFYGSAWVGG